MDVDRRRPAAAVSEVDFDGVVLEWSQGCEALYDVTREDAIGHQVDDLADWGLEPWVPAAYRRLSEGDVWVYHSDVTTKAGIEVPIRTVSAVTYDRGDFSIAFCARRDPAGAASYVSRSQPIKSILGQTEKVFFCDQDGTLTHVGPTIHGCLGYRRHELLGQSSTRFIAPEDQPAWDEMWQWALSTPGRTQSVVIRCRDATGHMRWLEANATSYLHYREVGSVVIFWRDLDEQRHAAPTHLNRAS